MLNKKQTIIFDLDDTLVDTSHLYWTVKKSIIDKVSSKVNISLSEVDKTFENIEHKNTDTHGHIPERYSISAKELCKYYNISDYSDIVDIAKNIYLTQPEVIPYAFELLDWCKNNFNIVLMTRGVEKTQYEKLEASGLDKYFKPDVIRIVPYKDSSVFLKFITELNTTPEKCWIIGDSVKSDIIPGVEAGIKVIHYNYTHHTYEWLQDKMETEHTYTSVNTLKEVKAILEKSLSTHID